MEKHTVLCESIRSGPSACVCDMKPVHRIVFHDEDHYIVTGWQTVDGTILEDGRW